MNRSTWTVPSARRVEQADRSNTRCRSRRSGQGWVVSDQFAGFPPELARWNDPCPLYREQSQCQTPLHRKSRIVPRYGRAPKNGRLTSVSRVNGMLKLLGPLDVRCYLESQSQISRIARLQVPERFHSRSNRVPPFCRDLPAGRRNGLDLSLRASAASPRIDGHAFAVATPTAVVKKLPC